MTDPKWQPSQSAKKSQIRRAQEEEAKGKHREARDDEESVIL